MEITRFAEKLTSREAIALAGLDWGVVQEPVQSLAGVKMPRRFLNVRDDNRRPIGMVSDKYKVMQNLEAFAFADQLVCDANGAKWTMAASINGGSRTVMQADFGGMEIVKGDEVRNILTMIHSHDTSSSFILMLGVRRISCMNELSGMIRSATKAGKIVRIRHVKNMNEKAKAAHEALGIIRESFEESVQVYRTMADVEPTKQQVEDVLEKLFPATKREGRSETQKARVRQLSECGMGQEIPGVRGTAWGLYNGLTELVDHYNGQNSKREDKEDYLWLQNMEGNGAKFKRTALQEVMKVCGIK